MTARTWLVMLVPSEIGVPDAYPYILSVTWTFGTKRSIRGTREYAERQPFTRAEAEALREQWAWPEAVQLVELGGDECDG